ncbi:ABC transporter permease [Paracoccus saliphilus]|uniref:ABC transporter permease n=1 Tax=Paracoccus saliphilus TaxID=405559 RepID=A0ABY7SGS4_9RHOB|nr:ABC transporter permease [Paracoccus saliphilus]
MIPIALLLIVLVIPALLSTWIAPYGPEETNLRARLLPPVFFGGTWEYPFGTDRLGRDILSRTMHGAWYALSISAVGIFVGVVIGSFLGLIAGYARGWAETIIMRLVDISLALPAMLLALALAALSGPSFQSVIIVVAFVLWAYFARQVRAEVMTLRERDFVARAVVAGTSHLAILRRHILPNVLNTIVVLATLQVGIVITLEASLSFLGIGIPRPTPTWGLLVSDGRQLLTSAWWISFFPGLAILLTVLSVNVFGDWLRDRFDPKLRDR